MHELGKMLVKLENSKIDRYQLVDGIHPYFQAANQAAKMIISELVKNEKLMKFLPKAMVSIGNDNNVVNQNSCLYGSNGNKNPNFYLALVNELQLFRQTLHTKLFSNLLQQQVRLLLSDNNKNIGFDSSKLPNGGDSFIGENGDNTVERAFPSLTAGSSDRINENHTGRIEFSHAEEYGFAVNSRWSGTLKSVEDRIAIGLIYNGAVTAILVISLPAAPVLKLNSVDLF